ncbi:MAG TPA: indole-3-glycerol phosphate synthase TrpC [Gemmatimonadaceae bacterium]|nr:indole-3-glycerol phosphate synthase TrpC [Gemmatimonadaceae bacterium]
MTDEAVARAATLRGRARELQSEAKGRPPAPGFREALRRTDVAIIAEVKRSSPSKGVINAGLDLADQVTAYEQGGAAAISILTEPTRFAGSDDDLVRARSYVRLPLLRKDFHVDVVQIWEARALGASAALVIARAVAPRLLDELVRAGRDVQLEIVVEVRDESELARALNAGAEIIGINNRNLETLEIDPDTAARVLPMVPRGIIAIAESGVKSVADVEAVAGAGADAVLVGSLLSAAKDPQKSLQSLTGVTRTFGARQS